MNPYRFAKIFAVTLCCLFSCKSFSSSSGTDLSDVNEKKLMNHILTFIETDYTDKDLYEELIRIRNGTAIKGIKKDDKGTYIVLVSAFPIITSSDNNLDQRAALNRASAFVRLADLQKQIVQKSRFHQKAYYIYTMISERGRTEQLRKAAHNNLTKLLNSNKIEVKEHTKLRPATVNKISKEPSIDTEAIKREVI